MKLEDITLSFSALKSFSKSPAHFAAYKKRVFKQSAPMRRGWLTHLLTLEPEKSEELCILDVSTRANKLFKETVEKYREVEDVASDVVFTKKEYLEAANLAEAVRAHPLASKLINEATSLEEHIHFDLDGVKFHGYADIIGKDYIADLKITDNEPRKLQRWVLDNLYNMQLALYAHGVFNSKAHTSLYLITCDPNPPYGVIVYEMSPEMAEDGIKRARLEVSLFKDFWREWDGVSTPKSYDFLEPLNSPMYLDLPTWHK